MVSSLACDIERMPGDLTEESESFDSAFTTTQSVTISREELGRSIKQTNGSQHVVCSPETAATPEVFQ